MTTVCNWKIYMIPMSYKIKENTELVKNVERWENYDAHHKSTEIWGSFWKLNK